ncbi:MAG: hypothetical protein MK086_08345 [Flavobacteriales bacterium]|nr:hypothetical protein [Flavobacteriales bacterium]
MSTTGGEKDWLMDAEVQYRITPVKGRWEVSLVFINTKNPREILVRPIGDYRSEKLAEIAGRHMQQAAAKDARGTQKVDKDAYDISDN